jgi:hypothetical protein
MITLHRLFQDTLRQWVAADATVEAIIALPELARDHSGAVVHFYRVRYTSAGRSNEIKLVTKDSPRYERQALAVLTAQHHPNIPFSYTPDLQTNAPMLLCQQYAGERIPLTPTQIATVATALGTIHAANQGDDQHLPWMRRLTTHTFFSWWRPAWQAALADTDFVREFHRYVPAMEPAAERFARVLDHLWQEGNLLTLLHTDLSAWHVLVDQDHPYLIDWEQVRYGPFYLDLPNFFTLQTVSLYYQALRTRNVPLDYATFLANFHATWSFVGLKYMVPYLHDWLQGERAESRRWLQELLPRALASKAP